MQRLQAYKFELMPSGAQQRLLRRYTGSCRFVYNKALVLQQSLHEAGEKKLGYAGLCSALTAWKREDATAWLNETPSQALQQALKDLERAYQNFFEQRAAFPRFKKKGVHASLRFPQGCKLEQGSSRVFLPKLGWLRYCNSREVLGAIKNVTVSQSAGKWFVSIQTEREVERSLPQGGAVGIDVGITRFATLSDGSFIAPANSFKRHESALRKAQRVMSRKTKFSNNWKKAKARVQQIHARIGNVRRDFLHKATHITSKNHALVCIEDLQVSNMSRSASGTAEVPGKQVRQKSGLNKAILDQGWFEFRRQLDYKLAWAGGFLIAVPPRYTSQTCPCCGHISRDNRQTQAQFRCASCGYANNADLVGAINILARGMEKLRDEGQDTAEASAGRENAARIVCGELAQSGRSVKQKPAEATTPENILA